MIPAHWIACRRAEDDELLGYVVAGPNGTHTPVTVFGIALDVPGSQDEAEQCLHAVGLSYLAERWVLDLQDQAGPVNVHIVEATPRQVTVKSIDYGSEQDYGTLFILAVPVARQLRLG